MQFVSISFVNDCLFANYLTNTRLCIVKNVVWRLQSGRNLWTFCWNASLVASIKEIYPENGGRVLPKCQNCIRTHGVTSQRTHLQSCQLESGMQGEWVARTISNISDYVGDQRCSVRANSTHFLFFERKYSARPKFLYTWQCHVFLLFVIFKAFAYFNGAKKRKKYFYYFFRKHVIILLNYHCRSLEKIGVRHLIFVLN